MWDGGGWRGERGRGKFHVWERKGCDGEEGESGWKGRQQRTRACTCDADADVTQTLSTWRLVSDRQGFEGDVEVEDAAVEWAKRKGEALKVSFMLWVCPQPWRALQRAVF